MSPELSDIKHRALELPTEDREVLVATLLESLRNESISPDLRSAWTAEAKRRYQELKNGTVEGIPADEALAEMRDDFGWATT